MKLIKPIAGIISPLGMVKEAKYFFEKCDCEVVELRNILDLDSCDFVYFPTSVYLAQRHYIGDFFLKKVFEKVQLENFPVWLTGDSFFYFTEHFLHLKKIGKKKEFSEEISLEFLDTKPFSVTGFSTSFYRQERKWFNFFEKEFEELGFLSTGECCIYKRKNLFVTLFSPELSSDKRIFEYFLNEIL